MKRDRGVGEVKRGNQEKKQGGKSAKECSEKREHVSLFYDLQQTDQKGWGPAECHSSCDLSLGSQKFNLTKLLYLMF